MPKIALKEHLNEIVEVEFDDHTFGNVKELIRARVWGRLVGYTNRQVTILLWESDIDPDPDPEFAVIARGAVIAVHRFKRVK